LSPVVQIAAVTSISPNGLKVGPGGEWLLEILISCALSPKLAVRHCHHSDVDVSMKHSLLTPLLLLVSPWTHASGLLDYFKDEAGRTNWQYVANWSSGILILLLSILVFILLITRFRLARSNRELTGIRSGLEERVRERTASLDRSNRLLTETNRLLEQEVARHSTTANLLRGSEAYIKDILESMPLMLVGLNEEGTITQWNRFAEQIAGVRPEQALGRNLWEVYPGITVSRGEVAQAVQRNKPLTIKHSQRGRCHFDITIYPLQEQETTGVVILIQDVTQRVQAENMLIQRDKMSSMGELASTMAHDIDAPLQSILDNVGQVRALLDQRACNDADTISLLEQLLEQAAGQGRKASAVIGNLLEFARGHADEKQMANVADIMEHSLELADDVLSVPGKLRFKDISIDRHYEAGLPRLPCYVSELQQVFLSLLRHCCHSLGRVKDRPGFAPVIRIELMECYDSLWIKIQHNGLGLTEEEQKYIFEPFFSTELPDDNYDAGKRLSFSHFIITEHHKGQMAVTSDVNVGTTFHMQIDLH